MNNFWRVNSPPEQPSLTEAEIIKLMNELWIKLVNEEGEKPNIMGCFTDAKVKEILGG